MFFDKINRCVLIYKYGLSLTLYVGVILVLAFTYINNPINKMIVMQRYLSVFLWVFIIEIYQLNKQVNLKNLNK